MAGPRPIEIMRRHEREEAADRAALLRGPLALGYDPGVAADVIDVFAPQPRVGVDGVAAIERATGRVRFRFELTDHPGAGRIDAAFARHEAGDRRGSILVARAHPGSGDVAEELHDARR